MAFLPFLPGFLRRESTRRQGHGRGYQAFAERNDEWWKPPRRRPGPVTAMSAMQLAGYRMAPPASYGLYRKMNADPTIAMARALATAPILSAAWRYVRHDDAEDAMLKMVEQQLEALRPLLLAECMRALDYGWRGFEKVWAQHDGQAVLSKLKPLAPERTEIMLDAFGRFAGLQQGESRLPRLKCFVYSYDREGDEFYGRSRHENVRHAWDRWNQLDERSAQASNKAAGIIPQVHYPPGMSRDAAGTERSNHELAQGILQSLASGRGVALPNLFATHAGRTPGDLESASKLAGKSQWVIRFLDAANSAATINGLTEKQKYYDTLKMRGWLMPERAATEATRAGSRADSEVHTRGALAVAEQTHRDLARQISWYVIDDILELNFGTQARGMVWIEPAPLQDAHRAMFAELLHEALTSESPGVLAAIDWQALLQRLDIPVATTDVAEDDGQ